MNPFGPCGGTSKQECIKAAEKLPALMKKYWMLSVAISPSCFARTPGLEDSCSQSFGFRLAQCFGFGVWGLGWREVGLQGLRITEQGNVGT